MICKNCSATVEDEAAYCRDCGFQLTAESRTRRLTRRPSSGKIAGVCEGLAKYFGTDVTLVRLGWILLTVVPGLIMGGVLAYVVCWALIPQADTEAPPTSATPRLQRSEHDRRIGGVCGGFAEHFDLGATPVRLLWSVLTIWPGMIVFGTALYLVAWFIMPQSQLRLPRGTLREGIVPPPPGQRPGA